MSLVVYIFTVYGMAAVVLVMMALFLRQAAGRFLLAMFTCCSWSWRLARSC